MWNAHQCPKHSYLANHDHPLFTYQHFYRLTLFPSTQQIIKYWHCTDSATYSTCYHWHHMTKSQIEPAHRFWPLTCGILFFIMWSKIASSFPPVWADEGEKQGWSKHKHKYCWMKKHIVLAFTLASRHATVVWSDWWQLITGKTCSLLC